MILICCLKKGGKYDYLYLMNKKGKKILKQAFFLSIGIALIWLSFSKSETTFDQFMDGVASMNYLFFGISAFFAITSHYFRALRWKLLIQSTGYNPKTKNVFASVLFMYASNVAIPRSGEVARCGTLYKYEDIPVPQLLGTVFIERAIDLLTLLFFTGLLVIVQFELFSELYFSSALPDLVEKLLHNKLLVGFIGLIGLAFVFIFFKFRKKILSIGPLKKVEKLLSDLLESLFKVIKMDKKLLFLLYTIVIWGGYVGMFYICFFAFEPTSHLTLGAGLTAFIAGSYGMVAPTNGGVGAWQAMVILALTTLGIASEDATIWANVAFFIMTITVVVAGLVSFGLLPFMNKNEKVS